MKVRMNKELSALKQQFQKQLDQQSEKIREQEQTISDLKSIVYGDNQPHSGSLTNDSVRDVNSDVAKVKMKNMLIQSEQKYYLFASHEEDSTPIKLSMSELAQYTLSKRGMNNKILPKIQWHSLKQCARVKKAIQHLLAGYSMSQIFGCEGNENEVSNNVINALMETYLVTNVVGWVAITVDIFAILYQHVSSFNVLHVLHSYLSFSNIYDSLTIHDQKLINNWLSNIIHQNAKIYHYKSNKCFLETQQLKNWVRGFRNHDNLSHCYSHYCLLYNFAHRNHYRGVLY
eukprot:gb/GECH01003417.1/.p1 GENE.gb/GECH01003417.1/~~gb/GECH01003417.1/.p1  ORF type:complete len:287 (+),score=31.92 gb/GECH01003417.1/:1-861(+)